MPFDDFGEDRKDPGKAPAVAARLDIGAPRLEEPQCGIDGVVFGLVAGAGKDIGQHAAIDEAGKGHQDVACALSCRPVARHSPGSADHRVAAPIAEPGIAGDHRFARPAARATAGQRRKGRRRAPAA